MLSRLVLLSVTSITLLGGCAGLERAESERTAPISQAGTRDSLSSGAPGRSEQEPLTSTASPDLEAQEVERALHRAVNRARGQRGRSPLAWRDSLGLLARRHSQDMARRSFFDHVTPDGAGPAARAGRLGLPVTRRLDERHMIGIGENLFRATRYTHYRDHYVQKGDGPRRRVRRTYQWKSDERIVQEAVREWLDSPPHRRALLSRDYERHGLGVAIEGRWIYVTQNLF